MKSHKNIGIGLFLLLNFMISSCSSGGSDDNSSGGEEQTQISGTVNVSNLDLWPGGSNKMIFRAYTGTDRSTIAFEKELVKSTSGVINFRVEDVPVGALSDMEIAIVDSDNPNNYDTRMYYGSYVVNLSDQISLPEKSFSLEGDAPQFLLTKIEDKVFAPKCFQCHNSQRADRDLDLSKWNSFAETVNVASKIDPTKVLVKPGSASESFLYQILENPDLAPDMITVAMTDAEMEQIRNWIDEGASEE